MKSTLLWVSAFVITLTAAVYQRMSGPTYPLKGTYKINGIDFIFKLPRSHGGPGDQKITISAPENSEGRLIWRLYPSEYSWNTLQMSPEGQSLSAYLPHQPPSGKIEYFIVLNHGGSQVTLPHNGKKAVTRFKGVVPAAILIPHILLMFTAMLTSNRAGLEVISKGIQFRALVYITFAGLSIGGFLLGCLVQYHAFGQAWTGFPFGHDLTDNKLAFAVAVWAIPLVKQIRRKDCRMWIIIAALTVLVVFSIPHSLLGSEIRYH
jgi:hypothetical protein